ncbi:MAG: DUF6421 family protein [Pseudonocardia sp.]
MISLSDVEREVVGAFVDRLLPLCNAIRARQVRDGSIPEPLAADVDLLTRLRRSGRAVLEQADRHGLAEAFTADVDRWLATGLHTAPDFARTRDAVTPPLDGEIAVFVGPAMMTNSEPPVGFRFEAFVARRREPLALPALAARFPHPRNNCQSLQLLVGSDGVVSGNCIVFFPENVGAARPPRTQSYAMFFYSKFRRIHETFAVPAARDVLTTDSLPWASAGLDPQQCYEARAIWGYLHDYFHHQGPRPFDEHMAVKLNWFVGLLEEIKVDCQTLLACAAGDVPYGESQIDMILLERLFRYPLDRDAERVFDAGTGVLLFSWLVARGSITAVGDGRCRLALPATVDAARLLVDEIEEIERTAETDEQYRSTAKSFVRRFLRDGGAGRRFAFTPEQSVLRRRRARTDLMPVLSFGIGEL